MGVITNKLASKITDKLNALTGWTRQTLTSAINSCAERDGIARRLYLVVDYSQVEVGDPLGSGIDKTGYSAECAIDLPGSPSGSQVCFKTTSTLWGNKTVALVAGCLHNKQIWGELAMYSVLRHGPHKDRFAAVLALVERDGEIVGYLTEFIDGLEEYEKDSLKHHLDCCDEGRECTRCFGCGEQSATVETQATEYLEWRARADRWIEDRRFLSNENDRFADSCDFEEMTGNTRPSEMRESHRSREATCTQCGGDGWLESDPYEEHDDSVISDYQEFIAPMDELGITDQHWENVGWRDGEMVSMDYGLGGSVGDPDSLARDGIALLEGSAPDSPALGHTTHHLLAVASF
jgi:hypothetical protein